MINKALLECGRRLSTVTRSREFLQEFRTSCAYMEQIKLITTIEVTDSGISFTPTNNPHNLKELLEDLLDTIFLRQSTDFSTYQWEADWNGITITILANEVISHNSTIPTK